MTLEATDHEPRPELGTPPLPGLRLSGIELLGVFALGVAVMTFLYAGTGGPSGAERGLPGYDDFYHAKMSVLMPRIGLIEKFPWLTTTIFSERFVNHHWGFQALMAPFVYVGHWLYGDWAAGARWAITAFFSTAMVLFDLLLITERVRLRWLWLGLFLVMPAQFFGRHVFVRAISLSLACMFAVLLLMFRQRYVWCAVVIALYVHIYLGALCYVPLLVGAYWFCGLVGTDEDDRVSWKLPLWTAIGLAAGWLTHPYRDGVFDFLKVQVFGSGLTPEISVGREWKSYEGKLWEVVFEYFGSTLSLLVVAIVARMRMGPRLNAREAAAMLINLGFLVLALRQRRFIEYWPPFGVLAAAMLVAPLLDRVVETVMGAARGGGSALLAACVLLAVAGWSAAVALLYWQGPELKLEPFIREWRLWALVVGLVALPAFLPLWSGVHIAEGSGRWVPRAANLLCGVSLVALVVMPTWWVFRKSGWVEARLWVPITLGVALAAAYVGLVRVTPSPVDSPITSRRGLGLLSATGAFGGAAFVLLLMLGAGPQLVSLQRSSRCGFDLPAIRAAMDFLKSASPKDSIVFTDDWDIFPVFFYHNDHNRFIVGLDPMFSYSHDPVLYTRYVKITQSKRFPVNATVDVKGEDGQLQPHTFEVRLEDIRDHFHAEYVTVDPDHKGLGQHLDAAPELAERVFPPEPRIKDQWPPYTIYHIKPASE